MAKINKYTLKGKASTAVDLPKEFVGEENSALLAQALHVYRDRLHAGTSMVKTRGEIARTTKKWFRQKGTGNARHGARSAPIFVGGGVAHGPKGVKRVLTLPKKMRRKALSAALAVKQSEKAISAFEGIASFKKTKDAQELVSIIRINEANGKDNARLTVVLSDTNRDKALLFRNIDRVNAVTKGNLSVYKIYFGGKIVLDEGLTSPKPEVKKEIEK